MMKNVAVVSLGCDKNRIDTEHMLSYLNECGYNITNDYDGAEIIIVNTCAFIGSAREEAVETILEMAEKKKIGSCKKLLVTGCLSQKYSAELVEELTEVDAFLGVNDYDKLVSAIESASKCVHIDGRDRVLVQNRIVTTPRHYAYLSVADRKSVV